MRAIAPCEGRPRPARPALRRQCVWSRVKDLKERTIRGGAARLSARRQGRSCASSRSWRLPTFSTRAISAWWPWSPSSPARSRFSRPAGLSAATVQRPEISNDAGFHPVLVQHRHRCSARSALPRCALLLSAVSTTIRERPSSSLRPGAGLHRQCHRRAASRSSAKGVALRHLGGH